MNEPVQVLGLGELLWDCFPDRRRPGGAPANVAYHVQQLGLKAAVVSRVGQDELGREICEFLIANGLSVELVQIDPHRQTGTVTISPTSSHDMSYYFLENSAWDFLAPTPALLEASASAKAICFGTLAQRRPMTRETIHDCLKRASSDCLVVYDVNLRPPFFAKDWIFKSLERANIVKMNADEVVVLRDLLELTADDQVQFCRMLLGQYDQLELVCVTRGGNGCLAVTRDESIELPGIHVEIADTVGAGDAFTGAVIFGRLEKWPLQKTLDLANLFGSMVASQPGAMPDLHDSLMAAKSDLEWAYRSTPAPRD